MGARLFSQWGDTRGVSHGFDTEATIGRAADNSMVLDFSAISGHHARITFEPERDCYVIEDLGSLNGTRVDGVRAERPMRLDRLHVIKFGRICEFIFQRLADPAPAVQAPAAEEPPTAVASTEEPNGPPDKSAEE